MMAYPVQHNPQITRTPRNRIPIIESHYVEFPTNRTTCKLVNVDRSSCNSNTRCSLLTRKVLTASPLPSPSNLIKPPISPPKWPPTSPPSTSNLNPIQKVIASALDTVEKSLVLNREKSVSLPKSIDPAVQLSGNFAPVPEHAAQSGLEVTGRIPTGLLGGIYLRNGANPMYHPTGPHHFFDGDGMIHAVKFGPHHNQASYTCRFTKTSRLLQETNLGRPIFPKPVGELHGRLGLARLAIFHARAASGILDSTRGIGAANAGLIYFNNRLLAMSEDDLPYHIQIHHPDDNNKPEINTVDRFDFEGQVVNRNLIAHPKIDPETGEFHTLSYDVIRHPHLKYYRFNSTGKKTSEVDVPVTGPTMIHDFAVTPGYVVIPDTHVVFKLSNMLRGESPLRIDQNKTSRFGVLPKDEDGGDASKLKWIDVPGCFCFHFINAWEEEVQTINGEKTNVVVVIGSNISPADSVFNDGGDDEEPIRLELTEIRLNLTTGESSQRVIVSGMNLEMGQANAQLLGRKTRTVFMAIAEPWPKCGGIAKVDLETGQVEKYMYGEGRFGGEPCFVPKEGSDCCEDEGWVMSFVRDEVEERSELVILTAKDMVEVAKVNLPSRVPYGFHGMFLNSTQLKTQVS